MFAWSIAILALSFLLNSAEAAISQRVYDNCEFLGNNRLQVSWTIRMNDSMVDFELCGCDVDDPTGEDSINEYMGFGLSGSTMHTQMIGADATIAYVDNNLGPKAIDYFLSTESQCREGVGACPDIMDSSSGCTDDITGITGFRREGFQCVAYSRPLDTGDATCDTAIDVDNRNQYIVWGVGGVGETAFKHFTRGTRMDPPIHLGREPSNECRGGLICPNCPPFAETIMDVTDRDETFVANIGPPAGPRGYQAIAGQAGWGISWYLNGTLIPRLMVKRGRTYTFISEGGDVKGSNNYHPFYLTNSITGGRDLNTDAERAKEIVYAGYDENGNPLGVGPYCEIAQPRAALDILNSCGPQQDYIQNLVKNPCQSSSTPGRFTWTPDDTTPNIVYYQCATHRNLGYEIMVFPQIDGGHRVEATLTLTLLVATILGLMQVM